MISSLSSIAGPAGSLSLPYSLISMTRTDCATSSANSCESGSIVSVRVLNRSFARSITKLRLETRTSSILVTSIFALHGPMRWITSSAAATMQVSALSSELGMVISPLVLPRFVLMLTSMRPIRPERWSSRNSKSEPNNPSVCPNTAPITSGLSTTPSICIVE